MRFPVEPFVPVLLASALFGFPLARVAAQPANEVPAVVQHTPTEHVAPDAPNRQSTSQLETWLSSANSHTRACVKESRLQLVIGDDPRSSEFKAAWKQSRAPAKDFSYTAAQLETGKSSATMRPGLQNCREVKVLSTDESERLFRNAVSRFVPAQPGHAIHCRYAFGDALLLRDANGQIQLRSGADSPAEIIVDRRFSRQELASEAASALEADLRSNSPALSAFLLTLGRGSQFRLALIDLEQRSLVILYVPHISDESNTAHFGARLSNLGSIILVDHVWTFLKNPFSASARTVNQWTQWPLTLFHPRLRAPRLPAPALTNGPGMDLVLWEQWLDHHTGTVRERGSARLLIDGDRFYPLLASRVAQAQSNVCIHVCIFDSDDVAVDLAERLKQRSTNVEVKVVFDRLMTRSAGKAPPATPMRAGFVPPKSIGTYLRSGSEVEVRPQPNPALTVDHSKVFLIDGRYAYVGGMNLGREYRYEWHDMMAEIEGPIVASYQRQFDKKWAQVGLWGDCGLAAASCNSNSSLRISGQPATSIELRRLYTKTFDRQIRQADLEAINRASSHIFAENPYFYSKDLLVALSRARHRGVDVRIILPSENDLGAGHKSNLVVANYLLEHGVRVYFYPGMTHVKAILVDGWACFGSANFDAMSLRLNREANLATSDPRFAAQLRSQLFEVDFTRSRELREPLSLTRNDYLADALLSPF